MTTLSEGVQIFLHISDKTYVVALTSLNNIPNVKLQTIFFTPSLCEHVHWLSRVFTDFHDKTLSECLTVLSEHSIDCHINIVQLNLPVALERLRFNDMI